MLLLLLVTEQAASTQPQISILMCSIMWATTKETFQTSNVCLEGFVHLLSTKLSCIQQQNAQVMLGQKSHLLSQQVHKTES